MEGTHGSRLVAAPHRRAYSQEIGPRLHQRRAVLRSDAADGDARYLHQIVPPGEQFGLRPVLALFGAAGKEGAERHVVGPSLPRFHRQVAAGVAGDTNLRLSAERVARLAHRTVLLAEMDAIRAQPLGKRDAVIDDKRDVPGAADLQQWRRQPRRFVLVDAFHPKLEGRHRPAVERPLQALGKAARHVERRNQVKLAIGSRTDPLRIFFGMADQTPAPATAPAPVRIGCSGWIYKHWRGLFYPEKLAVKRWFEFYAEEFDTVEINNSFYRLPKPETFEAWRDQAPPGFCYAVKANRFLTQAKKLKDCGEPLQRQMASFYALRPRLGPILYQLPPNLHLNLKRLETFLQLVPNDVTNVFEFRDKSWYTDAVFALLDRYGASFCAHDMPGSQSPRVAVGPIAYLRFHGGIAKYWGRYSDEALMGWTDWITGQARDGRPVWAYFNNDPEAHAIHDAQTLRGMVRQALR